MYGDIETGLLLEGISERSVRSRFVQKVFSLLSVQLVLTMLVSLPFVVGDPRTVQVFIYTNQWLIWMSLAMSFMIMIVFACFPNLMKQYPINYLLLILFTLTEGVSIGIISSMYTTHSVIMAVGLVTIVTISLAIYASSTKTDFTKSLWPYMISITVAMVGAGFVLMIFPSYMGSMIYAAIGAMLFSVYLVIDVQMLLGGKSQYQFSVDDYVPATICLYIDIVSLFIYVLQLFGERRED
jgi:FtsH-binding integral membrane protein